MMRGLVAVAALIVIFDWRLVMSDEYSWLDSPGVWDHALPLLQLQAGEVHRWRLPLWDPYTNGGQPLVGWNAPNALYPPHLAMLAMPLREGWMQLWVLHWAYVLIQVAMGMSAYVFARRRLALSQTAAVLAGCVYALANPAAGDLAAMHAAAFVPLVFVGWPALWLGLCWQPGNLEVPLATALVAVWFLRSTGDRLKFLLQFAIGAVVILPGLQFGVESFHFGHLTVVLVLLVAGGIAWVADRLPQPRFSLPVAVIGAAFVLFDAYHWTRTQSLSDSTPSYVGFALLAGSLILRHAKTAAPALALGLMALAFADTPRWTSYKEPTNQTRRLALLAANADVAAFLKRPREGYPATFVDPAAIAYDFGRWWGVSTVASSQQADFLVSTKPAPEFERLVYQSEASGVGVYGRTAGEVQARPAIRQRFRPISLIVGSVMTVLGFLCFGALAFRNRNKL